ncbi:MAG: TlpA disulfide reductase family protein [Hyphomicrobiaceae bacterium]
MFDPEKPPELAVSAWFNTREPTPLERLRGRVVVVLAFQMLCPACVEHAIPQAKRLRARFSPAEVAIIGLHSVFEHHRAMTPEALEVFVREFRVPFPVAIDEPDGDGQPRTMAAYQMQGTPTLLLFDRAGRLRRHYFGQPDDIMLAAEIMALAIEDKSSPRNEAALIERKLAATLVGESHGHDHSHHHHHHGDGCGCDHHDDTHQGDHSGCCHSNGDECCATSEPLSEDLQRRLAGAERMTEPPTNAKRRD